MVSRLVQPELTEDRHAGADRYDIEALQVLLSEIRALRDEVAELKGRELQRHKPAAEIENPAENQRTAPAPVSGRQTVNKTGKRLEAGRREVTKN